ncbi:MAG TPA: DUF4407 domain-containing protein [Chthoniobacteraceae bacterium]|jgi:hypothetical protein|nr:DUF4407 domain-containing protein [Chthoniobacteraceae bacterium]
MNFRFKHLFFWLSGAGTDTLESCPGWEQRKYVAFGATVLVPCLFAFIASAYAISTLTGEPRIIYPVAAVWSFIILSIDRALLASYRPFQSWVRKLGQFSLRFVVALLMGITIAHPLVLLLFRDTITTVIEKDRAADIAKAEAGFDAQKAKLQADMTATQKAIAEQRALWDKTFQTEFIIQKTKQDDDSQIPGLTDAQKEELKQAIATAVAPFNTQLKDVETQIATLTPQYTKVQGELEYWQSQFEMELNGQRSGLVGEGPRAKSIRADQLEPRKAESARLSGLIDSLTASKATLQAQAQNAEKGAIAIYQQHLAQTRTTDQAEDARVAALQHEVQQSQAETFVSQQNSLRATIKDQIDAGLAALKASQQELATVNGQEEQAVEAIRAQPRRDILTQTLALHTLFRDGADAGRFAVWTYFILTGLFMLVDTIPLVVKFFTKPGPYDTLLDRDEVTYDAGHKAFLGSHGRYMAQLSSGNLMSVTRNRRLEMALVDGVEHSRAAREFLDSLIEMEKAFAEKIRMEQESGYAKTPESRAALDAMKMRFYDDLQRRMETFFGGSGAAA